VLDAGRVVDGRMLERRNPRRRRSLATQGNLFGNHHRRNLNDDVRAAAEAIVAGHGCFITCGREDKIDKQIRSGGQQKDNRSKEADSPKSEHGEIVSYEPGKVQHTLAEP